MRLSAEATSGSPMRTICSKLKMSAECVWLIRSSIMDSEPDCKRPTTMSSSSGARLTWLVFSSALETEHKLMATVAEIATDNLFSFALKTCMIKPMRLEIKNSVVCSTEGGLYLFC